MMRFELGQMRTRVIEVLWPCPMWLTSPSLYFQTWGGEMNERYRTKYKSTFLDKSVQNTFNPNNEKKISFNLILKLQ